MTQYFAPVIPREEWRKRGNDILAACPFCSEPQIIDQYIHADGFTEKPIICRMPHCWFGDWVRLEGWGQ